jgi:hypothetical protein
LPQRLSQLKNDSLGTEAVTLGTHIELFWDKKKYKCMLPFNDSNIAIIWSTSQNSHFAAFVALFEEPALVTNVEGDDDDQNPATDQTEPQGEQDDQDDKSRDVPLQIKFFDNQGPVKSRAQA